MLLVADAALATPALISGSALSRAWQIFCLQPALMAIPAGDWVCDACAKILSGTFTFTRRSSKLAWESLDSSIAPLLSASARCGSCVSAEQRTQSCCAFCQARARHVANPAQTALPMLAPAPAPARALPRTPRQAGCPTASGCTLCTAMLNRSKGRSKEMQMMERPKRSCHRSMTRHRYCLSFWLGTRWDGLVVTSLNWRVFVSPCAHSDRRSSGSRSDASQTQPTESKPLPVRALARARAQVRALARRPSLIRPLLLRLLLHMTTMMILRRRSRSASEPSYCCPFPFPCSCSVLLPAFG